MKTPHPPCLWVSSKNIVNLNAAPSSVSSITRKAKKEGWRYRKVSARQGVSHEFDSRCLPIEWQQELSLQHIIKILDQSASIHSLSSLSEDQEFYNHISILPPTVRAELLARCGLIETSAGMITIPPAPETCTTNEDFERKKLAQAWEKANEKQHRDAERRANAASLVAELIATGVTGVQAIKITSEQLQMGVGAVRELYYRVKTHSRDLWPALLLSKHVREKVNSNRQAELSPDAWEFFLGDYLRPERPSFTKCYERLLRAAESHSWVVPSEITLRRKLERDVKPQVVISAREGVHALAQAFPVQERSVADLHAMEWINGDGYQHNVFVLWENDEVVRPKTWFWQDVYSRKIIGWRTDISENSDSIRLSVMDVISQYGKPEHVTIDNTRAAANKWLTGGTANRYRFKVKEDDPVGILVMLGMTVHWTSVIGGKGWGQAKPVERAFGVGGLGEYIDKHPSLTGAFTGENINSKPENYRSRAVDMATFLDAISEGVTMFNAKQGRETEICSGRLSFDQAFEESYSKAIITRLVEEQLRQLMLPAEAVRCQTNGTFVLECGGKIHGRKNTYWSSELISYRPRKIVVRFDPRSLHSEVICYDLDGRYLCKAECRAPAAFGDTTAAREHNRARKEFIRETKKAEKALKKMSILEVNDLLPKMAPPEPPPRHLVERMFNPTTLHKNIDQQMDEADEQQTENQRIFQDAMKKLNAEKKVNGWK